MNKRVRIMDKCPEEFREALSDFIDDIESEVNSIDIQLTVSSLDELDNIVDAKQLVGRLATELY